MKLPAFLSATLCLTTVVVAEPVREIESQILSPAVWEQGAALVDLSIQPRVETYAMGDHQGGGFKEPRDGIIPSRVESIPHYDSSRSDSHAPIGVMGDHTHAAGEVMVGVRYMFMEMDGMRYTDSAHQPDAVVRGRLYRRAAEHDHGYDHDRCDVRP